jgi:hypothetical protein
MGKDGLKSLTEMLKKDEVIIQNHNNLVEIFKNSIQESQHLSKDIKKVIMDIDKGRYNTILKDCHTTNFFILILIHAP